MTTFIRKNDDDGSIDRSLLSQQFEAHLIDGRLHDVAALLELIADHTDVPDAVAEVARDGSPHGSMDLRADTATAQGRDADPSRATCVMLDGLSEWVATAMHVNGDAPSSPGSAAIIADARAAILTVARDQLVDVFPDAWIGLADDVDGAVLDGALAIDHATITYEDYRSCLDWLTLLRMATEIGVAHNERLAIVG